MHDAKIGETVRAHYKSGTYIGEVMEDRGKNFLVKVVAVVKHPLQGDLHNYGKTEDVFFHQRKALSYLEKVNVSKSAVHPYSDEVPNYLDSLKQAVKAYREKISEQHSSFNQLALENLEMLEKDYFK